MRFQAEPERIDRIPRRPSMCTPGRLPAEEVHLLNALIDDVIATAGTVHVNPVDGLAVNLDILAWACYFPSSRERVSPVESAYRV